MRSQVGIVITTFRSPARLSALLANMQWAGVPHGVPIRVFEDPSPFDDADEVHGRYKRICAEHGLDYYRAPYWCCMHGIIDYAFSLTTEDWVIYVPDDIRFTEGGLVNEYNGILAYGADFVGGIQAPYWNEHDLVAAGVSPMDLSKIPRNPHWEGSPRAYINLNGAGFAMSRKLYRIMHGWPAATWRLDEWAGWQAWKNGMVILTLPGPPRVHAFGGSTHLMPPKAAHFADEDAWAKATGGLRPVETAKRSYRIMEQLPGLDWDAVEEFFSKGGKLQCQV